MTPSLHPQLVEKITLVLNAMAALGHPMKIIQGVRTVEQQQALYAQGRTKAGKIVTNCDGVRVKSNHQPQADNYGHAVDCAFAGNDPFGESQPWALYGYLVGWSGLKWGGTFKGLVDRPHAELP